MNRYIGLTIGPIYQTLQNARKTRELWAGSYIFSYIMKRIIKELSDRKFVIPYVSDDDSEFSKLLTGNMEVGVFHDRVIFKSKDNEDFKHLKEKIEEILDDISKKAALCVAPSKDLVVADFFKSYFQIYFCEREYEDEGTHSQISEEINSYLDTLELQSSFPPPYEKDFVQEFLKQVNKSFLMSEAFGTASTHRFRSIPEIAVSPLRLKSQNGLQYSQIFDPYDDKKDTEHSDIYDIYEEIEKGFGLEKGKLRQYHRYIAIVNADGDGMSDIMKRLTNDDDFRRFSKVLFEFDLKANDIIKKFSGETIFAGGDDLLFFAPVVNTDRTVIDLIDNLSKEFELVFRNNGISIPPTLSFGLSMSYYKFPLYEALDVSRQLLHKAKDKAIMRNKNAVAFRVLKHSGQYFEGVFNKASKEYDALKGIISIGTGTDDKSFLTSVIHNLFAQRTIIEQIARDAKRLDNFFANTFNESVHKRPGNAAQLDGIRKLILSVFKSENYKDNKKRVETIYGALRFNKFMRE